MKKIVSLFYVLSFLLLILSCNPASSDPPVTAQPPAAPDQLELDAVSSATLDPSIELSWRDNADNEEGFLMQRDVSADFSNPLEVELDADSNSYLDKTITTEQLYYYRVRAYNAEGPSAWSEVHSLTFTITIPDPPVPLPPAAPDELELDGVSSATLDPSIELSWRDNADNEEGYLVQRDVASDFSNPLEVELDADSSSYLDKSITVEQLYYYRVRAYNTEGPSAWSEVKSLAYSVTIPDPPVVLPPAGPDELELDGVSSATLNPSIDLTWKDNADNEEGYLVQRDISGDFPNPLVIPLDADSSSYLDKTITPEQLYYYRVRAYNAAGSSPWSEVESLAFTYTAPDGPADLLAQYFNDSTISLSWRDNSYNEMSFLLQYSESSSFTTVQEKEIVSDAVACNVTGLDGNKTYYFRLAAVNPGGASPWSNTAECTLLLLPDAPSSLTAAAVSDNGIDLSWVDNADNEESFLLEYSIHGDFSSSTTVSLSANTVSYSLDPLEWDHTWYFRLAAINERGSSAWSNSANAELVKPVEIPTAPNNFTGSIVAGSNSISLNWNDQSDDEEGFVIEYADNPAFSSSSEQAVPANQAAYTLSGLVYGTHYYLRVCAQNSSGQSSWAGPLDFDLEGIPHAPTGLSVSDLDSHSVGLIWTDHSAVEDRFLVSYSENNSFSPETVVSVNADEEEAVITGLDAETTYYFRVCADRDSFGSSGYTDTVSIILHEPVTPTKLQVNYTEGSPSAGASKVFGIWIENESEGFFKNILVCRRINLQNLTGIGLPFWQHNRRSLATQAEIDAVTSATNLVTDDMMSIPLAGLPDTFTLYFEVDHSFDPNDWFSDQPAILYSIYVDQTSGVTEFASTHVGWTTNSVTEDQVENTPEGVLQTETRYITHRDLNFGNSGYTGPDQFGNADTRTATELVGTLTVTLE